MIFGARAFFGYVPDAAGGTAWFANVPRHQATRVERESTTAAQWKRWLIELFANDRGPATALIEVRAGPTSSCSATVLSVIRLRVCSSSSARRFLR